jgi:hypothetical protein
VTKDADQPLTVKAKYGMRVLRVLVDFLYYDQINFDEFSRDDRELDFTELTHVELSGSLAHLAYAGSGGVCGGGKGDDDDDLFGVWKISMQYELPYLGTRRD